MTLKTFDRCTRVSTAFLNIILDYAKQYFLDHRVKTNRKRLRKKSSVINMQAPETPRKHAVLNIYLRDLAIENYPQIKHSCGV